MPFVREIPFTAPAAGEHKVAVPEEWLHKEEVADQYTPKSEFSNELNRRVASVTKDLKKPEDMMKDDEFLVKIADTRKADLIKILGVTPAPGAPDVQKIRDDVTATLTKEKIEPLLAQVKTGVEEISMLRDRDLDGQVLREAVRLGVEDNLLELVQIYVRRLVDWSPENKSWLVKKSDGSGFEFSADPKKGGGVYKGVKELMDDISRDEEKKGWFKSPTQEGGDFKGSTGDPRTMTVEAYNKMPSAEQTKWAASHPADFARVMTEIARAGESKLLAVKR